MTNKSSMNRRQVAGKLKVYSGTAHPHAGQNPQALPANVLRKTNVKK
jgi:ribosomal protein L13